MRIVSLLPSLTELVFALGRGGDVVGVTHECDSPPETAGLPRLTSSLIPDSASAGEIDALVSAQGGILYGLNAELLESLQPDLILTQEQCDVCAVNEATVRRAAASIAGSPRVESVNPTTLEGVFAMFRRVGDLVGAREEAESLISRFWLTGGEILRRRGGRDRPGVVLLEWTDPPYIAGHWTPEILSIVGARERLGRGGEPSRRASWSDLEAAAPEVLLLAPCGFAIDRVEADWASIRDRPEWRDLPAVRSGRVALIDGSAYFSRPGPRLEVSLRIAAAAIDPESCGDLAPEPGWKMAAASA